MWDITNNSFPWDYEVKWTNTPLAVDLLQNEEVEAIIGPGSSMCPSFHFLQQVPLSSLQSQYFIRATLNDSAQVPAIRAIVQTFGWREVVLIYVDNDALLEVDAHVTYWSPIHPSVTDDHLVEELHKLMRMPSRVFIVHMLTPLAYRLFTKANEAGMMEEGYVWILTDGITDFLSTLNASAIDSMQGVLGVKPHVPRTKELESFKIRWKKKIQEEYPTNEISELNIFGFWAYDAACALAMAVEKLGAGNFSLEKTNISRDSTSFESIRVSPVGLSGDFQIGDGQLRTSAFHIVNVIGEGERGVGFWTPENGIVRRSNSTSKANLRAITWPGESPSVPKGWVLPANGKKLKIGITGYCIKYDAVVGDTPILANRSLYVDFTLPYTESGVSMIVPIIYNRSKNAWVFLKPLTWDLWVTSACFFVFIGFVIWTLEHRINEDFREARSHQVGTIFWFSFSTLVFAQRERIVSNLARFVMIIWFFVVLILTQSYTASFTLMLTVQQLKPTITDINELIRTGQRVGYQNGSFIFAFLKQMKFDESNLVKYDSPEQLDGLFSNGSRKGGIAAAFDEIPYMKLFLAKYCSKYTAVQPTYKFDGFGFVNSVFALFLYLLSNLVEMILFSNRSFFMIDTDEPVSKTSKQLTTPKRKFVCFLKFPY
ncbi:hypothetical protein AAG906_017453 [Vitis piasezkii]